MLKEKWTISSRMIHRYFSNELNSLCAFNIIFVNLCYDQIVQFKTTSAYSIFIDLGRRVNLYTNKCNPSLFLCFALY